MLCSWVPNKAKSRSLGLAYSAGQVGNILAMVISPVLINNLGWEVRLPITDMDCTGVHEYRGMPV